MEAITIGQILEFLAVLAGGIGSATAVYAFINKLVNKKIDSEISKALEPVNAALDEIKEQNQELKEQGEDTKKEIILLMKLNQSMIDEMKTLGHLNGQTSQALEDLNDYLMNK